MQGKRPSRPLFNLRQKRKDWDAEKGERPDAAPPKRSILQRDGWYVGPFKTYEESVASPSSDAAQLKGDPVREIAHLATEEMKAGIKAPPPDSQPVAWRERWHNVDTEILDGEGQLVGLACNDVEAENLVARHNGLAHPEDAPEGPYVHGEIIEGRMCSVWHKDECSRDSVFMGSGKQAIAVRDRLNLLERDENG